MQPDDEVTKRYREIAREEPSASMDAAILAASRRALRPSLSRRWGAPVSIAAVLVLAFGLTLEMRHEEPGIESSAPARAEPVAPPAAEPRAPVLQEAAPVAKDSAAGIAQPVAPPALAKKERARPESKPESRAQALQKRVDEAPAPREAPARREAPAERDAPAAFPAAPPAAAAAPAAAESVPTPQAAPETMNAAPAYVPRAKASAGAALRVAPAQADIASGAEMRELERIAGLRAAGRDAEADKALEDFRRDHPGYRIPDAMWERVKPR